jgi:hypothetical protein
MNRLDPPDDLQSADDLQPSDEALARFWGMAGHEERRHPKGATAIATPTTTSQSREVTKKL